MNTSKKVEEIKALVETFSLTGLKIWGQYLWEYLFFKDLDRERLKSKARFQIVQDLWNHACQLYSQQVPGQNLIGSCYMKNMGKYPWLEFNQTVQLEILDSQGFLQSTVKHETSYIEDSWLYLKPVSPHFDSRYSLKVNEESQGYWEADSRSGIRLSAMDLVRCQYFAGLIKC